MSNKVWFITGASRGLGPEFAKAALEAGDYVVASSRSAENVANTLGSSDKLFVCSLDVTNPEAVIDAVKAAVGKFGRIDVLVNNAGYGLVGALEECSREEVEAQYRTNVFGLLDVTKAVLPIMRIQKNGHIINISSLAGFHGIAGVSSYCGTKFAIEGLSESLANELTPLGIRVTVVEPGAFRTDFHSDNSIRYAEKVIADYEQTAGATRKEMSAMNGHQISNPRKLAVALVKLVNDNKPPFRFTAGSDAVETLENKIASMTKELNQWRELSVSMAYEPERDASGLN
jgi:NAD(P)-dependent dehydrogenase (short-subunit alcohol dehydrogenase family)